MSDSTEGGQETLSACSALVRAYSSTCKHNGRLSLQNRLIGGSARTAVDDGISRVLRIAVAKSKVSRTEELFERFAELSTHATIDRKVYRVREHDEEVREQNGAVECLVVGEDDVERVLRDMQHGADGQRDLREQEHGHHHYEHERRAIRVTQLAALRLAVLLEELVAFLLGATQGAKEEEVEDEKCHAGSRVHEDDSEAVVQHEVDVLRDCLGDPRGGRELTAPAPATREKQAVAWHQLTGS